MKFIGIILGNHTFEFWFMGILVVGLSLFVLVIGIMYLTQYYKKLDLSHSNTTFWSFFFLGVSIVFIFIAFLAPLIYIGTPNYKSINYQETGVIGDTIGGLMNPFISISAAIITGLAFYVQFQANKQQKSIFEKELAYEKKKRTEDHYEKEQENRLREVDNKFYRLLALHKENVNEIELHLDHKSVSSGNCAKGRRAFIPLSNELEYLYLITKSIVVTYNPSIRNRSIFQIAYRIFFEGYFNFKVEGMIWLFTNFKLPNSCYDKIIDAIEEVRDAYNKSSNGSFGLIIGLSGQNFKFDYKPFIGHSSRLAHYFRHLYMMVKYIAEQDVNLLTYGRKRDYLKLLRAQLSNDEQVMLFYNWLGGYGARWEERTRRSFNFRVNNSFFVDYRMIHNIQNSYLILDFDVTKIFTSGKCKEFLFIVDKSNSDVLFEIHGVKSLLLFEENLQLQST